MKQETVTMYNGNKQRYTKPLPKIQILDNINDTARAWIKKNTGLDLKECHWGYEAQPTSSKQIAKLLLTYDFKTRYFDNWNYKNTLMLKLAHYGTDLSKW